MASTNGITGDSLINKPNTKEFEDGWDRIFGKQKKIDTLPKKTPHKILKELEIDKHFKDGTDKPNGEQFGNITDTAKPKET
jgi:hypothetical protein